MGRRVVGADVGEVGEELGVQVGALDGSEVGLQVGLIVGTAEGLINGRQHLNKAGEAGQLFDKNGIVAVAGGHVEPDGVQ